MFKIRYFATCAALAAMVSALASLQARAADNKQAAAEKQRPLIERLRSDAPPQDKAIACKQLAIYGDKDAVPALAPLLCNAELSSWARIALEAIPDPAADEALREALGKVQGRLLVGVINSIGFRRDAKAIEPLVSRLKDADAEVVAAAAVALGCIGGDRAATVLHETVAEGSAAARAPAAEGCIRCAERFLAEGNAAEAIKLYDFIRTANVPKQRILEATRGAILARKADGVPLLVEQWKSSDKALFAIGLRTARELPGREVTEALVAELGRAAPERQALLILALADRRDASTLPTVLVAAKSGPDKVRIAAIRVLERLGDASCVPVLLAAAVESNKDVAKTATDVLAALPGQDVDSDLANRLAAAEGKTRLVLVQIAGRRLLGAAVPALLKAADDPDAQLRAAALTSLGATVEFSELPVLIDRVAKPQRPEDTKVAEAALAAACARMPDREACADKLVAAMPQATPEARLKFLEILSVIGGGKALHAVGAAAKASDSSMRDAAFRLLGAWMTPDAAPVLLDLAKSADDAKYKTRALRGYLRIARQMPLPAEQRIAIGREALKLCDRDEERKLALEVFRRNPGAESLALVLPYLQNASLKADACSVAVSIAEKIAKKEPAAVANAMKQVVEAGGNSDVIVRAKRLLEPSNN